MTGAAVELRVGVQLWFDGEVWTVQELTARAVTLAVGGRARCVALPGLVAQAVVLAGQDDGGQPPAPADRELVGVLLSSLTVGQLTVLEQRAGHVRELLSGLPVDAPPLNARYQAKAVELGVSVRTLKRWVAAYRDAGVAGLADTRLLGRYSSGVDPRWDAACLRVLDDLVDASTPTMSTVLARVGRELAAEHGPGTVALPSKTTAYLRLKQLANGRHAFGSGQGRRSVAARPPGVYGRLRAGRAGEYVVLDSTPLDVFAMEPVTLRRHDPGAAARLLRPPHRPYQGAPDDR